jgi:hypothetical protein
MTNPLPAPLFGILLLAAACSADVPPQPGPGAPSGVPAGATVLEARCGCVIEGIQKCGNYVRVDGKYVPLVHPTLGKMEFCAQKAAGARIEVAGAMQEGKFVATSWKRVP